MRKFIPSFADHLARYVFAVEHCYKRKVLDVGCKEGFGSQILSYGANEIDLLDIEPKFLESAKQFKYLCPVKFIQCDLEKEFPEGEWDTMTAFEVIEHVEDPEFLVKNISERLKAGGKLVFSVPHMVANHEHKTLFDEQKIKDLISKYLTIEEFYIQEKKIYSGRPMYKNLKCYLGVASKK